MHSTNGHSPKRAVLYARVSSDEQARHGYSLDQQIGALRGWAAREGYETLEEVRDEGWSGAYLERPGFDRVRDLVESGGVSIVLAQDADRITRDPGHRAFLDDEFERFGTRLVALDDWGDETHEGELLKFLKGWVSKGERLKIAERSRRGRREKALRGETVGHLTASLGFAYMPGKKSLMVDPARMPAAERIFRMAAKGKALLHIKKALERDGVPTARGKRAWSLGTLHTILRNDVYRSRDIEELRAILPPGVAARLDPEKRYGVWWYGRQRHHQKQTVKFGADGQKRYHRGSQAEDLPREQWVTIPVPDCGIPPHIVDAARTARYEYRQPATTGYVWQLSGGVMRCGGCGHAMSGVSSVPNKDGTRRRYYRCHHRARNGKHTCPNGNIYRVDKLEPEVWEKVSGLLKDPERLLIGIERMIEEKRSALRGAPTREHEHWRADLEKVERMRSGYLDQQAEGLISMGELRAKLARLDERRETAERELGKLARQQESIAELERNATALMERYRFEAREGLDLYTPEDKHDAYRALGIEVVAHPNGSIELTGNALAGICGDNVHSKPRERSHSPLSTEVTRPLFTVTPPPESR